MLVVQGVKEVKVGNTEVKVCNTYRVSNVVMVGNTGCQSRQGRQNTGCKGG